MNEQDKMISRYGKIVSRETLFKSALDQYNRGLALLAHDYMQQKSINIHLTENELKIWRDKWKEHFAMEEEMTYSVIRYENNEVTIYLGSFSYDDVVKQIDKIIDYFKTSEHFDDFYLLENQTGKLAKLSLIEKKKAQLATKYGVMG